MTDNITKTQRSYIMSQIRGTRTKPELIVKEIIDGRKLRYQPKGIPERPDFANKSKKIALFIDGCFWHKCPRCYKPPKSNRKYWKAKVERNTKRDKRVNRKLKKQGWTVIRFWEHQVKENKSHIIKKLTNNSKQNKNSPSVSTA
uniref:DNA mismatch endonuclease (Vsr) n=1 Tax=uncultured marine thaumarchaeote AD1000_02_C08 TaxID=1455880 RepID=A0A075FGZ9_9ARCH|nr:DNA mismatch endonuclease (vsr) [uncultured marine thaumarchaeote AD1000_02_C08]